MSSLIPFVAVKAHAVESLGCLSGIVGLCCSVNQYKKYKNRAHRRKAFDGERSGPGNAYSVVETFQRSKFAMQKANGGALPLLELRAKGITVDHSGKITTTYEILDLGLQPIAKEQTSTISLGMNKLWRKKNAPEEIAPKDVMEPVRTFLGESKVNESLREEVEINIVPSCMLAVGLSADNMFLHGFRDGPCISLPWHGFHSNPNFAHQVFDLRTIFVRCLKTGLEKQCRVIEIVTHNKCFQKMNKFRGTGLDSLCLKLGSDDWSCLGAGSLCGSKRSNPFMSANGYKVVCFAQDFTTKKIYRTEGNILPDIPLGNHGLVKHTCNTEAGCSGTPLWSVVNGRFLWSGMHIGNWDDTGANVGVSVSAYGHLRRLAGLVIKTPKVSSEMLNALRAMSTTTNEPTLQGLLDNYLATIKEDVDEIDVTKLAPKYSGQLYLESAPSVGHASLNSISTSTDITRSYQATLDLRTYQELVGEQDGADPPQEQTPSGPRSYASDSNPPSDSNYDSDNDLNAEEQILIGGNKAARRAHKNATDVDQYQRDNVAREELVQYNFQQVHGDAQGPVSFPPVPQKPRWADFTDESLKDLLTRANIRPSRVLALARACPKALSVISEETLAGSEPPSLEEEVPKAPKEETSGVLTVGPNDKESPETIPFEDLQKHITCQSLPSKPVDVAKESDEMAKIRLGFDHANYSSSRTVIETESELRALTEHKADSKLHDPQQLIHDVVLGRVTLSSVAHELETCVTYSDLRDSPLLRGYWDMVDTTAEQKEIDPRPLTTKSGKVAESKDGDLMARVVAEISPAFKGGTTTQPQRLPPEMRAALERVEAEFRREAAETQDPKLIEALMHANLEWDWALPPTSSSSVKDSLVAQLKRLSKGGFKRYPKVAESLEKHWSKIISRYDTVDVTGDLDHLSDRVSDAFAALDLTKSSGWSSRVVPGTKEAWSTGNNRVKIEEWIRIRLLIHTVLGSRLIGRMSPYLLVKAGCKDPEELFIKMEVHKPKKQASLRWRLIWNPSLLDTLVLYALHVRTNKKSLEQYEAGSMTHQVLGMGHHDEGIEHLGKIIEDLYATGEQVTTSDASAWDFSVRRDGFYLDAYRRIANTKSTNTLEKQLYDDLLLTQAALLSAHVVAIGSELVEVLHFGILSSGILSTGDINSFLRTTYAFCAGAVATMACSDDLVAAGKMDLEHLDDLGIIEPEAQVVSRGQPIDFTSHKFLKKDGKWIAIYNNVDKLFNGLILKSLKVDGALVHPGDETASGQRFALRHNLFASNFYEKLYSVLSWHLPEASAFAVPSC